MPYVDSTAISWLDWDAETGILSVRFNNAPVLYAYADVPRELYEALLAAPAKNAFLNEKIEPHYRLIAEPLARAGDVGPVDAAGPAPTA